MVSGRDATILALVAKNPTNKRVKELVASLSPTCQEIAYELVDRQFHGKHSAIVKYLFNWAAK